MTRQERIDEPRRSFLIGVAATGLATGCAASDAQRKGGTALREGGGEAEVTPGEDLMQEHGVLERILLIYDEAAGRLERAEPFEISVIARAAGIVRRFVEDYHEKLEEQFVFPRLESGKKEVELVGILRRQHERGRELTVEITRLAASSSADLDRARLSSLLASFQRMYRPHAAREDTVLFPAFRELVGPSYRELGEEFEEREHALLGEGGFKGAVAEVAKLEAELGIEDLARFTP